MSSTILQRNNSRQSALVLLNLAKCLRTFAFGCASVILAIFLTHSGFSTAELGAIICASLLEDAAVVSAFSMYAGRFGSCRILMFSSLIMMVGGLVMACTTNKWWLAAAMIFGTISPSGYEAGLFGALEQAMVPNLVPTENLTRTFSNYNLYGFAGAAIGALVGSSFIEASVKGDRTFFLLYAGLSLLLFSLYFSLNLIAGQSGINFEKDEREASLETVPSVCDSMKKEGDWTNIGWLAGLQGLDSFGGGFVAQTFISLWFVSRFNASPQFIGWMLCLTNVFASVSFLLAPTLARRFGLLRTMVFTHLPCSIALAVVPFMPSAQAAAAILVVRSLFSSMDIPTRQAFAMVLVRPEMRTQAASITTAARAIAQAVSPMVCGASVLNAGGFFFLIGGLIKSTYDGLVFLRFRNTPLHMPEQTSSPLPRVHAAQPTLQSDVPNRELVAMK